MTNNLIYYMFIFLWGICIGGLLLLCICRFLKDESNESQKKSKNMSIWHVLVPMLNGMFYALVFYIYGFGWIGLIYSLVGSSLIVVSVVDLHIYEIPKEINYFIGILGLIRVFFDLSNVLAYLIGFASVSLFLLLIYYLSKGRGIGGGDIKLMATGGLVLGFPWILLAFILACIIGSIVHWLRMMISKEGRELAFGPYLSVGMMITMIYGKQLVNWYMNILI